YSVLVFRTPDRLPLVFVGCSREAAISAHPDPNLTSHVRSCPCSSSTTRPSQGRPTMPLTCDPPPPPPEEQPVKKKRGPKPKKFEDRPFDMSRMKPVKRQERSYSARKRDEVLMFLIHTRIHDPNNPRADENGYRRPTQRETAAHFRIPNSTVGAWYKDKDKFEGGKRVKESKKPPSRAKGAASTTAGSGDGQEATGEGPPTAGPGDGPESTRIVSQTPGPVAVPEQ
ncbi:hypothetical protein TOPH_03236, partial [Tolypocladium ophioglossoides CBS 100239]